MRLSQYPISTLKEVPSDAEVISHQLMLRTGMIRRLAAGLYTWLPLGLRTLRKVEQIIREEMNRAGALELIMPAVQPAELWQESGRWSEFGPELLRLKDRHDRDFAFGLTEGFFRPGPRSTRGRRRCSGGRSGPCPRRSRAAR